MRSFSCNSPDLRKQRGLPSGTVKGLGGLGAGDVDLSGVYGVQKGLCAGSIFGQKGGGDEARTAGGHFRGSDSGSEERVCVAGAQTRPSG